MKKFRFLILISGVISTFGILIFNLYQVQIQKGSIYDAKAASQNRLTGVLEPKRGTIYFTDRSGNLIPAALNKEYPIVYAVPKEIEDIEEAAAKLNLILDIPIGDLAKKLSKRADAYELLAAKIKAAQIDKIKETAIKGVYLDTKNFRFYPFGTLGAHVLGFLGPSAKDDDVRGRYGLESYYDEYLEGKEGFFNGGKIIEPVSGSDLILTIDRNIQAQAEEILRNLVSTHSAKGGMVIVEEAKTGKILSLANDPTFDPNNYSKSEVSTFLNPAIENIYEPGSVFKVITMSAGLDSGQIIPEMTFVDTGSLTLNGKTIKNWGEKIYGKVDMSGVLENSINTGAAFIERKTGHDTFYDYLIKFGFNRKTDIGLPGEVNGNLKSLEKNVREINFATASFGQGIAVTAMELIQAIAAIGNDGILMKPYLLAKDGPQQTAQVIKSETARQVAKMMASTVKKAQIAYIPNYTIAGKTGTAQVPNFKRGGYTDEFIHTFVGFAPAVNPKFIVLIRIDKPAVGGFAGLTVVPAFRELAEFIINYYNIPPDDLKKP